MLRLGRGCHQSSHRSPWRGARRRGNQRPRRHFRVGLAANGRAARRLVSVGRARTAQLGGPVRAHAGCHRGGGRGARLDGRAAHARGLCACAGGWLQGARVCRQGPSTQRRCGGGGRRHRARGAGAGGTPDGRGGCGGGAHPALPDVGLGGALGRESGGGESRTAQGAPRRTRGGRDAAARALARADDARARHPRLPARVRGGAGSRRRGRGVRGGRATQPPPPPSRCPPQPPPSRGRGARGGGRRTAWPPSLVERSRALCPLAARHSGAHAPHDRAASRSAHGGRGAGRARAASSVRLGGGSARAGAPQSQGGCGALPGAAGPAHPRASYGRPARRPTCRLQRSHVLRRGWRGDGVQGTGWRGDDGR